MCIRDSYRPGSSTEVKFNRLPRVAALRLQTEACRWLVAAVNHAILAPWIARDSVDDAVAAPVRLFEKLAVAAIVAIRHEITRRLPAPNIARRNRPRAACELPLSSEKLEIERRAEDWKFCSPLFGPCEFLDRRVAREEKILRIDAEALNHVALCRIVLITGRDRMPIDT